MLRVGCVLVAGVLLVGCSSEPADDTAAPARPSISASSPASSPDSTSPSSVPTSPRPALPGTPATTAPAVADQLRGIADTLADPGSGATEVQQAGELQQLVVRSLAEQDDRFVRAVIADLRPAVARDTRLQVRAARLLRSMTDPQRRLPPWRIVAPPPVQELRAHYGAAQRRLGVHWSYLAAIHLVETRMGRIRGTSTAGAQGPMQFLPSTWAEYGAGGDIDDPADAIMGAARLLVANGAPRDMPGALFRYNPSDAYVGAVLAYARTMRTSAHAYRGYWHWRVLYRHQRGTYLLPVGYPRERAVLLVE